MFALQLSSSGQGYSRDPARGPAELSVHVGGKSTLAKHAWIATGEGYVGEVGMKKISTIATAFLLLAQVTAMSSSGTAAAECWDCGISGTACSSDSPNGRTGCDQSNGCHPIGDQCGITNIERPGRLSAGVTDVSVLFYAWLFAADASSRHRLLDVGTFITVGGLEPHGGARSIASRLSIRAPLVGTYSLFGNAPATRQVTAPNGDGFVVRLSQSEGAPLVTARVLRSGALVGPQVTVPTDPGSVTLMSVRIDGTDYLAAIRVFLAAGARSHQSIQEVLAAVSQDQVSLASEQLTLSSGPSPDASPPTWGQLKMIYR